MDRDTKFSAAFRDVLAQAEVESVVLPPRSPNLNAHMERFFGSLKAECLDRLIFFGEDMLRRTVREYVQHYHEERNHHGCAALLPSPSSLTTRDQQFFQPCHADPSRTRGEFIGCVTSIALLTSHSRPKS